MGRLRDLVWFVFVLFAVLFVASWFFLGHDPFAIFRWMTGEYHHYSGH